MSNIDDAVRQAQEQAATTQEVLPAAPESTVPAPMPQAGGSMVPAPSAESFMNNAGISADVYAKVTEDGIKIGDIKGPIESFVGEIDMQEVSYCWGAKAGKGNNVQYIKTYDQVRTTTNKSWPEELKKLQMIEEDCAPYPTADIPIELVEDVTGSAKGSPTVPAESIVGLSLSTTGYKAWNSFIRKMKNKGLLHGILKVKVGYRERNGNGNTWGVYTFTLEEVIDDGQ